MKYLVTGGCGFIGSHLVDLLENEKNSEIIVLDNLVSGKKSNINFKSKKIRFYNLDISKFSNNLVNKFKDVNIVFHLAGLADIVPSINKPEKYFDTNVKGTLNILKCCQIHNIKKIIYAASASCYGIPKKFPTNESSEIKLNFPYALTKKLGEDLVMHWTKVYKLNAISLRLFNVYGLRSRTSGAYGAAFGVFLAQKYNNEPLTIVGNGKQTRDFVHVSDVINAFYLASKSKISDKIFNVGYGKEISVNYIANKIGGKKVFIEKRPGEPERSCADISKIKKFLKWKPKIKIDKGIEQLLKNIHHWKNAPVWNKKKIKHATKNWFKYLK